MKTLLAGLSALLLTGTAIAQVPNKTPTSAKNPNRASWRQEPSGYRDVPFGATQKEAREKLAFGSCDVPDSDAVPISCIVADLDVNNVSVHNTLTFSEGKLVKAAMYFPSDKYDEIRQLFYDKYGPPMKRETRSVGNKLGAAFENEFLTWSGKRVDVQMMRYASNLDMSMASFTTIKYEQEQARRAKEANEKAKSAF